MRSTSRRPPLPLAVLTGLTLLLLSGCATTTATAVAPSTAQSTPSPRHTSPAAVVDTPLPAALMICAAETQGNIAKILSLSTPAKPDATWSNDLYTCTYRVPTGTLRLSVKQSASPTEARGYFTSQQNAAARAQSIQGLANLGLPAYQTPDGEVSFVKDNMTLLVDSTQLSQDSPGQTSRAHVAYQIATAILGCWNG